ncbi:MAG: Ig-like domain-containing protein [Euryarchaeota archaeon]|nr:Ig-like domain-containing protein [Euryarchaeota archaeon]
MYQKAQICFLSLIVLLLVVNSVSTSIVSAQDEPALSIEIDDSNTQNEIIENTIFEGKSYDVIVNAYNETGFIFDVLDVNVSFLGSSYNTSTEFVTLQAPLFEKYESFNITATKDGYLKAELEITVMKGELSIVADRGTIEEKKEFQVTVKDQNNKPVADALVYVTPEANPVITDLQGVAYALAPDVEMVTTATIQVIKSGYFPGSTNIRIENAEGFAFNLTESQFLQILPILIAVLVVIFAIVYVLWRQKRTSMIPHQTTRIKPTDIPHTFQQKKQGQRFKNEPAIFPEKRDISISIPQSRVDEIRIPVQRKKKETSIVSEETKVGPVSENQKKEQNEWFKGQDYMRYKIDELTGKIDQKTDGKWFEGEHDIKYKVDETLKKNLKKKKVDEEDI